jgi:hypothetical protein
MSDLAPGGRIKSGDWYAFCDECGRRFFGSTLMTRWDSCKVCNDCYESRHPQDFIETKPDQRQPPFVRPSKYATGTIVPYDPTTQNWYDVQE